MKHAWDELGKIVWDHYTPPANFKNIGQFHLAERQAILQDLIKRVVECVFAPELDLRAIKEIYM